VEIKIKRLRAEAVLPRTANPGDAGMDLCAADTRFLHPGKYGLIPCGFAMELPAGTEAQIRPRSGLALKYGISVLNAPGTIDEGYRGEVAVILINHGHEGFQVRVGDRIAQMVIKKVEQVDVVEVEDLSNTKRGEGGFGSTGV